MKQKLPRFSESTHSHLVTCLVHYMFYYSSNSSTEALNIGMCGYSTGAEQVSNSVMCMNMTISRNAPSYLIWKTDWCESLIIRAPLCSVLLSSKALCCWPLSLKSRLTFAKPPRSNGGICWDNLVVTSQRQKAVSLGTTSSGCYTGNGGGSQSCTSLSPLYIHPVT